jgi:hypothetical protein
MITSITKEQEVQIPVYIKKWVDLASKKIDRSKIKDIFKKIYKEDKVVVIGESFQNTIDLIRVATEGKKLEYDSQLHLQLHSQLESQLDLQLYSKNLKYSYYISYYLYDWAGYYDYADKMGVEFDKNSLKQYFDILLNIPICIFIGNVIFVCEKPQCSWNNRLFHSDIKPAIGWEDGTGFYFLNGVRFEKDLWEKVVSRKMSFKEVVEIQDIDQRTQAMAYCPPREFLENRGKLLDKSKKGNELWLIPQSEGLFRIDAYFLYYKCCSTGKEYLSGVDPKVGEKKDSDLAMSWKFSITLMEYQSLKAEA